MLEVQRVAWALASTLAVLNGVGLVHGDLRPENVLLLRGEAGEWPLLAACGAAAGLPHWGPGRWAPGGRSALEPIAAAGPYPAPVPRGPPGVARAAMPRSVMHS